MDEVQAAIDARKPDFAAFVEPQKAKADIVVQVLLSDLIDDPSGKFLKVKLIQNKDCAVKPAYFFDQGSKIEWMPNLEELVYIESQLCDAGTKYYGELTEQMVKNKDSPGSENGTGLFQTVCSFKIREAYEAITAK